MLTTDRFRVPSIIIGHMYFDCDRVLFQVNLSENRKDIVSVPANHSSQRFHGFIAEHLDLFLTLAESLFGVGLGVIVIM